MTNTPCASSNERISFRNESMENKKRIEQFPFACNCSYTVTTSEFTRDKTTEQSIANRKRKKREAARVCVCMFVCAQMEDDIYWVKRFVEEHSGKMHLLRKIRKHLNYTAFRLYFGCQCRTPFWQMTKHCTAPRQWQVRMPLNVTKSEGSRE